MNRLTRLRQQQSRNRMVKTAVVCALSLAVVVMIAMRLHGDNNGYKYGAENYHVCVEVYHLNEDCK